MVGSVEFNAYFIWLITLGENIFYLIRHMSYLLLWSKLSQVVIEIKKHSSHSAISG
jgi:hypothetical protein